MQETWPKFKNKEFWNASAKHVAKHSHCSLRTGNAMRSKVINNLCKQFSNVEKEEEFYEVNYEESVCFTSKEGNVDATIPTPWEASGECLRVAKESFVQLPLTMKEKLLDEQLICFLQEKCAGDPSLLKKFPDKCVYKYIQSV